MRYIGIVIPFSMAAINMPFFPNPVNVFSACVCAGLGFVGIWIATK